MHLGWTGIDTSFVASVASIVLIDLLLAGDNAVVIAMAVRPLPPEQRRRGIALGAAAAVMIRVAITFFVAQLLTVRFVKLVGGVLIVWIALKLFADEEAAEEGTRRAATPWQAMRLIVIADVTMSIDNMLAVGGASHGSLPLLLLGLCISIPFVVVTSDLLSRLMDRFPSIVYAGAAILGKVGADMILTDPYADVHVHPSSLALHTAEAFFAIGIVVVGRLRARAAATARAPGELE